VKEQQRQAEKLAAGLALERGRELCDQGQGGLGPLWLARALRSAVQAEDAELERVIRTNLAFEARQAPVLQARWPHGRTVTAVAFSPDGRLVLTGGWDRTARLRDVATGELLSPPLAHQGRPRTGTFSPNGQAILTGSDDEVARPWETATRRALTSPPQFHSTIYVTAFAPEGGSFAVGSGDGLVRLWNMPSPMSGDAEAVQRCVETTLGMELDGNGVAKELDAQTWQNLRRPGQHASPKRQRGAPLAGASGW
jgi:hypothetical protein